MDKVTLDKIRETERNLSFDSISDDDVLAEIEARSGNQNVTPGEDLQGNGGISASDVIATQELQNNPALQTLIDMWKGRRYTYRTKSELSTIAAAERLSYLDKAKELEIVLGDIAAAFEEAANYKPTSEEKLRMPARTTTVTPRHEISEALEPDWEAPSLSSKDENSKKVAASLRQTKEVISWLEQNPKSRLVD